MRLEAVDGRPALVLDPAGIVIVLAGRRDDRGIDDRAGLHTHRLRLELPGDRLEQGTIQAGGHQGFTKAHEGGALRHRLGAGKTAEPAE